MQLAINQTELPPAIHARVEIKLEADSKATQAQIGVAGGDTPIPTITLNLANAAESVRMITPPLNIDWNNEAEQRRFALLERKVGRKSASEDEAREYSDLLFSRRAWIKSQNYMAIYLEERREQLILQKLQELQSLMQPLDFHARAR